MVINGLLFSILCLLFHISIFCQESPSELSLPSLKFDTLTADFTQEKKLSFLQDTVIIHGILKIINPDTILWETNEPVKQTVLMHKNKIYLKEPDTPFKASKLSKNHFLKGLKHLFVDMAAGNFNKINKHFIINQIKESQDFFECIPKTKKLLNFFTKVTFHLDSNTGYIKELLIEEKSLDYMKIKFKNVQLNTPLSYSDLNVLEND